MDDRIGDPIPAIDDFVGLTEVGRGGFSRVFSATQISLHRKVAIKVITTTGSAGRRLERETIALGALSQIPHVVTTYQVTRTTDGNPALVMALMSSSIGAEVRAHGPVRPDVVVRWASQIAGALDRAHSMRIFHRDLKPENVLISSDGDAYLADFGIAALDDLTSATTTSLSISPPFAPPERFTGAEEHPLAGDVYSLAATIYAALAGRPPYGTSEDGGSLGLMLRVAAGALPPIESESASVNAVLARALATDPSARHPSASTFATELAEAFSRPSPQPMGPSPSATDLPPDTSMTVRRSAPAPLVGDTDLTVVRPRADVLSAQPCPIHGAFGCQYCVDEDEPVMADQDRVVYDVSNWPVRWTARVDSALAAAGVGRAWSYGHTSGGERRPQTLTVAAEEERRADEAIDGVLGVIRLLEPSSERELHPIGALPAALQDEIEAALDADDVRFERDPERNLLCHASDGERVRAVLLRLVGDGVAEPDGATVLQVLSDLWDATGTLMRAPTHATAVLRFVDAVDRLDQLALPYGIDPARWPAIVTASRLLRSALESEDANDQLSDDELRTSTAELHAWLDPLLSGPRGDDAGAPRRRRHR